MIRPKMDDSTPAVDTELSAVVRAGCFASEEDAVREAVQTMFAVKPQLRMAAAIRRYLDEEITLGRAAELVGMTRWRFQELLAQRGARIEIESRPAKELDAAVDRIRNRRRCSWPTPTSSARSRESMHWTCSLICSAKTKTA